VPRTARQKKIKIDLKKEKIYHAGDRKPCRDELGAQKIRPASIAPGVTGVKLTEGRDEICCMHGDFRGSKNVMGSKQ
jgi:hypothetical protein